MADTKKDLEVRKVIKGKKPDFPRTDANKIKRLSRSGWRKAKGRDNKIRRRLRGAMPSPSYGSPKSVKGMHPRGMFEVIVYNLKDLADVGKELVVRIAATVGNRKKTEIVKEAKKLGLHVLNPRIWVKKPKETKKEDKKPTKDGGKKSAEAKDKKK